MPKQKTLLSLDDVVDGHPRAQEELAALRDEVKALTHGIRAYRAEMESQAKDLSLVQVRRSQLFNLIPR